MRKRSAKGGMTLVEVLVAMFIFLIGVSITATLFPIGMVMQRASFEDVLSHQMGASIQSYLDCCQISENSIVPNSGFVPASARDQLLDMYKDYVKRGVVFTLP